MHTPTLTSKFQFAERVNHVPVSFIREILKAANNPHMISFAGGLPNPSFFPIMEMAKAAQSVLESNKASGGLQYSVTEGYYPLRKYISDRYRQQKRMDIPPEQILITNGSQQALDLLGKVFINPKDTVLIERPSYLGAIQCMSMFEPQFKEVTLQTDGIDLEEFKDAYCENNIKLGYCIPNFHNPMGITYSTEKRIEIAKYIRRYSTILVEDDPYGDLYFDECQPDPIKSYNPEQVVLLGSFSKTVAPGLRLGWVTAVPEIMEKLVRIKQATDLQSNQLAQCILYEYLQNNNLDLHLSKIRCEYRMQRDLMVQCLRQYLPQEIPVETPKGGMFLWLTLPKHINAHHMLQEAVKEGVIFVPGNNFYLSEGIQNTIRLNFSNASTEQMEIGIKKLGKLIHNHY